VTGIRPARPGSRTLRIADRLVEVGGEPDLFDRALGPLAALIAPAARVAPGGALALHVARAARSTPGPPPGSAREDAVVFEPAADGVRVRAAGVGCATWSESGPITLEIEPDAPDGDAFAERVTIPALAERLRREGIRLIHAAVADGPFGVHLVPAQGGRGKTTLALSLRRAGWRLLADDRGWLVGSPGRAQVDPWPEAPRVGDRSLFLLPGGVAAGPRDERTGKAPVPALTPPRLDAPVGIAGVLLPGLVDGPGGLVEPARGARPLAAVAAQAVVATSPDSARASLDFVAALLARVPAFDVEVGDDPERLAHGLSRALRRA